MTIPIPRLETPVLIETSFADAITIIAGAQELTEQTRRHWATSLRQIAKALDKPLEVIPARYSAVRADLAQLHHAPAGLTVKTLQNHKSNAKSALLWLAREKGVPEHGAPLTPAWEQLRTKIGDSLVRFRLSAFMRFCSASKILPSEVNEAVVDRFMDYRSRAGTTAADAFRRPTDALWISSTTGGAMTTKNLGTLISKITLETLGVDVSPPHGRCVHRRGIRQSHAPSR